MAKIIYYFGAGASCNSLPLVKDIPQRVSAQSGMLKTEEYNLGEHNALKLEYLKDLNFLCSESARHASVDTLAKKLYIRRQQDELRRLKLSLSLFLTVEQICEGSDSRYDAFFASLIDGETRELPKEMEIFSWNYDQQFELAYTEYSGDSRLESSVSLLNICSKNIGHKNAGFGILKLNGTIGYHYSNGFRLGLFSNERVNGLSQEILIALLKSYGKIKANPSEHEPNLSFAWEKEWQPRVFKEAQSSVEDAEVLVVIGYSFPFFNREIDRSLIESMLSLKKVYFQDPTPHLVMDRFHAVRSDFGEGVELIPIRDTEQFFIPPEL